MSIDKNHSEQFERYLKGQMSPEEAHAFESEILDDPFAMEALEGFESQGGDSINDLNNLRKHIKTKKKKSFQFMRVAAVVALLIVGSYSAFVFTSQLEGDQLAMEDEPIQELTQSSPAPDTVLLSNSTDELDSQALITDEDPQTKTFNQDGLKVADKDDEVAQLAIEEDTAEELIVEELSEEVFADHEAEVADLDEFAAEEEDNFAETLQGRVAGVQAEEVKSAPSIDTSQLDDIVITAQPLIAKKESVGSATTKSDIQKRSKELSAATSRSTARETISGKVTDEFGEPLPGVNVVIKGTTSGVTTDVDGNYELPKTDNQTLVFSFIGFTASEIEVGSRSNIDVTLGGATELQEVVVTGYGEAEEKESSYKSAQPEVGNRQFKKYLSENLVYPEAARTNEIEGTVVLELTINDGGSISDVSIKKSLGYGCDQEAIRLVNEGPKWNPAERNGKTLMEKVRVRVKFKLD